MVCAVELVGDGRLRANSLARESQDALGRDSTELTSILTRPRLTGVAPTNKAAFCMNYSSQPTVKLINGFKNELKDWPLR